MSRLQFSLANETDDAQLRARMAQDWMPGSISVSFRREPCFFYGSKVQGESAQVIKCVDAESGSIVGLGSRLLNDVYLNGKVSRSGYLADLRGHPAYRGGTGLARGYRYFRQLHEQDPVAIYYSMILEGNHAARKLLTSGRVGLPCYRDLGRFVTPAVFLDIPRRAISVAGVVFRQAQHDDIPAIFKFLADNAPNKQLSPVISLQDFGSERLRGLQAQDFYVALSGDAIVAVAAAWDQNAFRQTYVEQYNSALGLLRPLYNFFTGFTPLKPLPAPGHKVPYFYLSMVAVRNNEVPLFRGLLRYIYNQRRKGPWNYFIAGLHERDPLLSVLREYRRIDVGGRLYAVHYPENQNDYEKLDDRIPYVEIAMI